MQEVQSDALQMHFHPGAAPTSTRRSMHLRQGELDGACGVYVLVTALSVLGVLGERSARAIHLRRAARFSEVWMKGLETYFWGSDLGEMRELVELLRPELDYEAVSGSQKKVTGHVVEALRQGAVVAVGLDVHRAATGHWVLVIGREERRDEFGEMSVSALLCLDPSEPAPTLAPFNARIELTQRKRGAKFVRLRSVTRGMAGVRCEMAISLYRGTTGGRPNR